MKRLMVKWLRSPSHSKNLMLQKWGVTYDEVREAGEHLPGMEALWDVATPEEWYEMVMILLEPEGLFYDIESKMNAALKPRRRSCPFNVCFKASLSKKKPVNCLWQFTGRNGTDGRRTTGRTLP